MGLFSSAKKTRYGAVVDIGSGSVAIAIVQSNDRASHPIIVWSHREHAPLRDIESVSQSAKAVMAALVNASLRLDSEGRGVLQQFAPGAIITELQCSISAPWSYTVTKTINYEQTEAFTVSKELLRELVAAAQKQTEDELAENESISQLGLAIVTRAQLGLLVNGYPITHPEGESATTVAVTEATVVAQQYLLDVITEMQEKLFIGAKSTQNSFILMLYCLARDVLHNVQDMCLVDITYEATEIGVARDGVLNYCTHTSFGSFSLARELSAVLNVPLYEAFGYLSETEPFFFTKQLSLDKQAEVGAVFEAYTERIAKLFHETGDELSIPKYVAVNTDVQTPAVFLKLIEQAAKRATKLKPAVVSVTEEIAKQFYAANEKEQATLARKDTGMLVSTQFFHKGGAGIDFDYQ